MRRVTLCLVALILTSCGGDGSGGNVDLRQPGRYQLLIHGESFVMTDTATGESWGKQIPQGLRTRSWQKLTDLPATDSQR